LARGGGPAGPDGLVVVDKAMGWTSHDVVAKCRGLLGTRKVGHSGTLDPDATGVLLVGAGRMTRLLRFLTDLPKTYEAEIVLGVETSTLDAAGEVTARHDMTGVSEEQVFAAAAQLTGDILQVPPMVSAVKIGGRRLHELARQGLEVEREARPVTVHRFALVPAPGEPGVWRAEVDCSSGTYVRVLAADLGVALGGGAHLRALRRTAIGSFRLREAVPVEQVGVDRLLPLAEALRDYPAVVVDDAVAADVRHGKVLASEVLGVPGPVEAPVRSLVAAQGPWRVLDGSGSLLAVYETHRSATVKPAVVVSAS
jgi:tRNA pseudouridine55 synthase